ncbi:ExeM/NucH family extracellular endonuclease [Simiduia curdlanivorans]|uniref:ExeM/NucH family extracellular endonuclease n=1 Tax=Simiduia curdlanivorans TaxID=1492769 RepID=A0ABV8V7K8_9GAMM|nr:ExeM/NucH family extracellular endonuclease [Simiduia curdlanivorans]MDN3640760.1 ExeM/NucH family extracellular endonuclease [Simiduia curdlanivorans]
MKNHGILAAVLAALSLQTQADLVITGVFDGPLPGGLPKGFELYTDAYIADLSIYGAGSANNGGGSDGQEMTFPAIEVGAGNYLYVTSYSSSYGSDGFTDYFGFTPTYLFNDSTANINGDDAIEIFKDGIVIDQFGDINVDGTGTAWDHQDGWAYRNNGSAANHGVFAASEWRFSGADAWDGELDNAGAVSAMPIASFSDIGDSGGGNGDGTGNGETLEIGACSEPATLISGVQGTADSVTNAGEQVVVEGIVTGLRSNGFFLQEEAADYDDNSASSEGIFIFGSFPGQVIKQHIVRVLGEAGEYYGNSQIKASEVLDCGLADEMVAAVVVPMPYEGLVNLESLEGMVASVNNAKIFSLDNFTKYGEMFISDDLKWSPTDVAVPLSAEYQQAVANATANILLVEDSVDASYPDSIDFYSTENVDGLNYANAPRVGDVVSATGPLNFSFGAYRINPSKDSFAIVSSRQEAPDIRHGNLSVASFNVLNYFNGKVLDDGSVTFSYPENRGAGNAEEFALQEARIVKALAVLDADVVGLIEIENDGFGRSSAIRSLVTALNREVGRSVYRYAFSVDESATGTDAISNAIIYKHKKVRALGLMEGIELPRQESNGAVVAMRNSLVQRFVHRDTGDTFAVVVNHFKSKGSACYEDENSPTDLTLAQGSCNALRVSAAVALGEALEQMPLPEKRLVIGDLNSYSQEDPIAVLTDYSAEARGYTIKGAVNTQAGNTLAAEVTKTYGLVSLKDVYDPQGFSYFFYGSDQVGSLDHVLASPAAAERVVDVSHWNINGVELYQLQYDQALSYYNAANGDQIDFTGVGHYRSSDHDPVLVTLSMEKNRCRHRGHHNHDKRGRCHTRH